ncbi:MAG: histidine kinase [Planctomycetaceae bacterium]|nr:histidine kinase [Planctomycetaceae bacterium]
MLVLSRGVKEKIVFPNLGVKVEILRVAGNRVRVGVDAPRDVRVLREEIADEDDLSAETLSETARKRRHAQRNQLNTASLALRLMEKQIAAGMQDDAMGTLHKALRSLDAIDAELGGDTLPPKKKTPEQCRALVVEDNANESELLAGYLRMSGFAVDVAADGVQAMVQLSRHDRPDAVLLDMNMPRMNGGETVRLIRRDPGFEGVRLFAVTGSSPGEFGVPVGPQGVDRWFTKPIDPAELVKELRGELIASTS